MRAEEEEVSKRWFSEDEIERQRLKEQAKEELRVKLAARGYNVSASEPVTGEEKTGETQVWIEKLEAGSQRDLVEEYDRMMAGLYESEEEDSEGDDEEVDF